MYLQKALILESGPIKNFEIEFEFAEDCKPKPTVIVGKNGAGKSNFLSFVTDALIEIAATKFLDVAPKYPHGNFGHQWHRIIGRSTIRTGSKYELALLQFFEEDDNLTYVSKGGVISKSDLTEKLVGFPEANWPEKGNHKAILGPDSSIEQIFRQGCYASFPSDRGEVAHWSGIAPEPDDSIFFEEFQNILGKPISLRSTLNEFRPWLVDILMVK